MLFAKSRVKLDEFLGSSSLFSLAVELQEGVLISDPSLIGKLAQQEDVGRTTTVANRAEGLGGWGGDDPEQLKKAGE